MAPRGLRSCRGWLLHGDDGALGQAGHLVRHAAQESAFRITVTAAAENDGVAVGPRREIHDRPGGLTLPGLRFGVDTGTLMALAEHAVEVATLNAVRGWPRGEPMTRSELMERIDGLGSPARSQVEEEALVEIFRLSQPVRAALQDYSKLVGEIEELARQIADEGRTSMRGRTDIESTYAVIFFHPGGIHNDRDLASEIITLNTAHKINATLAGQHPVDEKHIRWILCQLFPRLLGVLGLEYDIALLSERHAQHIAYGGFIFNNHYTG